MARTPETTRTREALSFLGMIKSWDEEVKTVRRNALRTEINGFKLITGFVENQLGNDSEKRYLIDNQALITASTLPGIQAFDFSTQWLNQADGHNLERGTLRLEKPKPSYGATNGISIEFKRGELFNEWDGMNIFLKYHSGYDSDIDSGKPVKNGDERLRVYFDYSNGRLRVNDQYYQLSVQPGIDFVELLNKKDTLDQLGFVAKLLGEAFSENKK